MGGDTEMDVLVETLWSLQVPGSVTALGRLALRCWREGRAAAVQTYLLFLWSLPFCGMAGNGTT